MRLFQVFVTAVCVLFLITTETAKKENFLRQANKIYYHDGRQCKTGLQLTTTETI